MTAGEGSWSLYEAGSIPWANGFRESKAFAPSLQQVVGQARTWAFVFWQTQADKQAGSNAWLCPGDTDTGSLLSLIPGENHISFLFLYFSSTDQFHSVMPPLLPFSGLDFSPGPHQPGEVPVSSLHPNRSARQAEIQPWFRTISFVPSDKVLTSFTSCPQFPHL